MFCSKSLHESCRIGESLICLLGYYEFDGHTVHQLSQRGLTADLLALREGDCSQTQPVLEIFKMAGYFGDRPRMSFGK